MSDANNIAHAFRRLAEAHPDLPAIIATDIAVPYGKLWRIAELFAVRMRERGIGPRSTVALDTTDMIVSVATMFAAARLGARFVAVSQALLETRAVVPTHFLKSPEVGGRGGVAYIEMDQDWSPGFADADAAAKAAEIGFADAEAPWWILHTSGTTGAPKFMQISQSCVHARSLAARGDFRPFETRLCSLFPCFSRPFHVRAAAALLNACTIVDSIDPAFMHAHGVTLVCGAPRQAVLWVESSGNTSKFKLLQVSGAALPDVDALALLRHFEVVEDVYGASETNKSFVNVKSLEDGRLTTVGKPADSTVEIVDIAGAPVPPGCTGRVRVRNGYMAAAYLGAPEASARAFRDGWFHPGDLATWGPHGELRIVGRVDELLNIGGHKVNPADVDRALMTAEGIRRAACFQDPAPGGHGRILAFVELAERALADTAVPAAHAACLKALGPIGTPEEILVIDVIPATADGSPRRGECRRLYQGLELERGRSSA